MPATRAGTGEVVIVWLLAYVFFLLTLANNFSASHDSINYLLHISRGDHLFHQHHLLYHFLARQWMLLWSGVFRYVPEFYLVESFTALWGSGVLTMAYVFFRGRFGLDGYSAAGGVAAICFSYGVWFYSVNIEVYTAPLFFILCALYVMTRSEPKRSDALLVGLLHSAAILFHQSNVLFAVVIVFWLIRNRQFPPGRFLLRYLPVVIIVTGTPYLIVGWMVEGHDTLDSFRSWLLGYTVGHDYWQPLSIQTPFRAAAGFARSFFGAHFAFQVPPIREFLQTSFANHGLDDEIFLARTMPSAQAWTILGLCVCIGLVIVTLTVRLFLRFSGLGDEKRTVALLLLTILVYSIFFLFWVPEILEFWILQMVLTWLLLLGSFARLSRWPVSRRRTAIWMIAAGMFVVNYAGSMRYLGKPENDWYRQEIGKINPDARDLVIIKDRWILKDYARYFTHAQVIATDEQVYTEQMISEEVRRVTSAGGSVYLHENSGNTQNVAGWRIIQSY